MIGSLAEDDWHHLKTGNPRWQQLYCSATTNYNSKMFCAEATGFWCQQSCGLLLKVGFQSSRSWTLCQRLFSRFIFGSLDQLMLCYLSLSSVMTWTVQIFSKALLLLYSEIKTNKISFILTLTKSSGFYATSAKQQWREVTRNDLDQGCQTQFNWGPLKAETGWGWAAWGIPQEKLS